jgi:hypothetical protein
MKNKYLLKFLTFSKNKIVKPNQGAMVTRGVCHFISSTPHG